MSKTHSYAAEPLAAYDKESALQYVCSPHEHSLSGLNLACEIP